MGEGEATEWHCIKCDKWVAASDTYEGEDGGRGHTGCWGKCDRTRPAPIVDRSRTGSLVHSAKSSGRWVRVVAYLEGGDGGMPIEREILCRTAAQAAEVARVLSQSPAEPPEQEEENG